MVDLTPQQYTLNFHPPGEKGHTVPSKDYPPTRRGRAARSVVRALTCVCQRLEPRTLFVAPADLDPTFGSGGKATLQQVASADEFVTALAPGGEGRLLVGGHRET